MEDKYFIPNIKDIRIEYECEMCDESDQEWFSCKIENQSDLLNFTGLDLKLRTLYLTKEQIENEGWEYSANYEALENSKYPDELGFLIEFEEGKRQYLAYYNPSNLKLKIEKIINCGVEGWIYQGKCPSINEFRTIMKFLEIK